MVNATLRLHVLDQILSDPIQIEAYPLLHAWNADEATWEQATNTDPWSAPGASSTLDRTRLPSAVSTDIVPGQDAILDLTSIIQIWRQHPDSAHGLLLRASTNSAQSVRIASFEYSLTRWRPRLEISLLGQRP